MTPTCCEKSCRTQFCPHCGAAMREQHPVNGLLRHVQTTLAHRERQVQKWKLTCGLHESGSQPRDRCVKYLRKSVETRDKWAKWELGLRDLMEQTKDQEEPSDA